MSRNIETIRAWLAAWNAIDLDGVIGLLADDVCYHNMPVEPIYGSAKVRAHLQHFLSLLDRIQFDVSHIAESSDGAVLVEKVEHYWFHGNEIILDSMNAFAVKDGKITLWRAYFDPAKWAAQMPAKVS